MNYAVALAAILLFVVSFRYAGIVPVARAALAQSRSSVAVILDRTKSDDEKERASREAAVALFGRFLSITGLTLLACIPSLVAVGLAVWGGIADQTALIAAMESPWLIAAAFAGFALDYAIRR